MRKAISLIELVFAIVIMGFSIMAFPLILSQTSNAIAIAIQQEAVLAAKTYIGTILSHDWDKNSVDFSVSGGKALVLHATDSADFPVVDGMRKGHIVGQGRRKMLYDATSVIYANPTKTTDTANWGSGDKSDVDDFNKKGESLSVVVTNMDSILKFDVNSTVVYVADSASYANEDITFNFDNNETAFDVSKTSNIKMVTVAATNSTVVKDKINIVLKAYSSNIGEYDLLERSTW